MLGRDICRWLQRKVGKTWEESRKVVSGGRLVWYTGRPDVELWTEHWGKIPLENLLRAADRGNYPYRALLQKVLLRDRLVIEAGCGPGHIVLGLQRDGFDVIGIEWSRTVVERVKAIAPDCRIRQGDVLRLDIDDGWAGSCISLGVVEHFREGPDRALTEANRVLMPGGCLVLAVPYFNPWREWKARYELYPKPPAPPSLAEFYQYAFSEREMSDYLRRFGFTVTSTEFLEALLGIGWECGRLDQWLRRFEPTKKLLGLSEHLGPIRRLFGHNSVFIARKTMSVSDSKSTTDRDAHVELRGHES